ncbi:hypothetical protein QJS10_CPA16g01112 [Acorus calamus]|uniref:Uncharacterized protein n=1 Tax=Acorus calamus TaxID=4465 RepID=A0AAV9D263_ACOCL|nr:hypothetical protein QJS10_CPA16g01112 [Acorus calamus]
MAKVISYLVWGLDDRTFRKVLNVEIRKLEVMVLVECDGDSIDLSGDVGAVGRVGVEPSTTYENLGLPPEWYGALEWVFPTWARTHALDKGEAVNVLKGAVVTSDRILTVSELHREDETTKLGVAWEINDIRALGYLQGACQFFSWLGRNYEKLLNNSKD